MPNGMAVIGQMLVCLSKGIRARRTLTMVEHDEDLGSLHAAKDGNSNASLRSHSAAF